MWKKVRRVLCHSWMVAMVVAMGSQAGAREAIDMVGRQVTLPEDLQRVYVASPPENHLACAIDPDLMVGLTLPLKEGDRKFLPAKLWQLPVIGGFYGLGHTPNLEVLLKARPQLVICWQKTAIDTKFDAFLQRFDIPIAYFTLERLQGYPQNIRVMGRLLGRSKRSEKLAVYAEQTLQEILPKVEAIPVAQRVRVYYAEGADGLSTDGRGTWHAELIDLAGGFNVHPGDETDLYGMEKISLEQVLLYQPEVMLVQESSFYQRVFTSPQWRHVPAVKNRRVYLIPRVPFNWFDRPPSFMRLLGLKWLAHILYPQQFDINMQQELQQFYRLFMQVEVSPEDARLILQHGEEQVHE